MIIGTAGHVDHGKTALVRALTGVDTDRLKEEKARGISIDLGFAYKPTASGDVLAFIDVPGHERFVHTMLAGAAGIDFLLLVIAADDGVMPQTREHLAIADLLGLRQGLVVLTKVDLLPLEARSARIAAIRAALKGSILERADILPVSVVSGEGVAALGDRLVDEATRFAGRSADRRFRLTIDRSFTLKGAGTIVTGTVQSGLVRVGDHLMVSPSGLPVRVRSIHAHNHPAEEGRAGERCALNLAGEGVTREAFRRGDVVLDPVLHAPTARIDATLRVLASEGKPVGQWFPVRFHTAALEIGARIVLLAEPIAPGDEGLVQLVLAEPIPAIVGDAYVVRDTSAQRTVGGGRFLDLRAPGRKRCTPERHAMLAAHALDDPQAALAALLALPPHLVELSGFARDHALGEAETMSLIERLSLTPIAVGDQQFVLTRARWEQLEQRLRETLDIFHRENPDLPGIGLERLRLMTAPRLPAPAFAAALRSLGRAGAIALDGAWVSLAGHKVQMTPADEALWEGIRPLLGENSRFRPPRVRDIAGAIDVEEGRVRRLLKRALRMGWVDEVAHDHFFLRDTVAEMVALLRGMAGEMPRGEFTAAQFRDCVTCGRKVAIQILEFFDRHGVTLRRGDLRRLNRHRLGLFEGGESSPVGRPDFKSGRGREPVLGGFDSHSLPPIHQG